MIIKFFRKQINNCSFLLFLKKALAFFTSIWLILFARHAFAGVQLETIYPYSLDKHENNEVISGSTMPLYINITNFDNPEAELVEIKVHLPSGFTALPDDKWQLEQGKGNINLITKWLLPANFGQTFDLLYLQQQGDITSGEKKILIEVKGPLWQKEKVIAFNFIAQNYSSEKSVIFDFPAKLDNKKFNWYIQSVNLPVDVSGYRDDRTSKGGIYIRDTSFESFRNRMTGDGATNWSAVFNHPATYLLLDMRNPQQDVILLKFKAELVDKTTGKLIPGLCAASKVDINAEHGWAGKTGQIGETTALISLDGKKTQSFILPLYVDYFTVLEGEYKLRVTVSGGGQEKIQEVPLSITKKHNLGFMAVIFSFVCLLLLAFFAWKIKHCIFIIGARGAITVALFAALAFGGITVPTTIIGDLLHVFLGPFSGLVTGILSGVLQYVLIVALLVLFRSPGVVGLMFFIRYILAGLMFGHFTPLGFLSTCVSVTVLESVLYISGFYRHEFLTAKFMFILAVILGLTDAFIAFINLEQMMFFYRLYYADWYIALYMLVNGLLYSSIGAWLGYRTGNKLQQVMGE